MKLPNSLWNEMLVNAQHRARARVSHNLERFLSKLAVPAYLACGLAQAGRSEVLVGSGFCTQRAFSGSWLTALVIVPVPDFH